MSSLVSKKLWGQDFSLGYFLIHTKKKSVLSLFLCWGICCFCLGEHCSQNEGLHSGSVGKKKKSACRAGDPGSPSGSGGSPGEGRGCGLLPGESQGQRSLVGSRDAGSDALSCMTCHARALGQSCDTYGPPRAPPHTEQGCDFGLPKSQKHLFPSQRDGGSGKA